MAIDRIVLAISGIFIVVSVVLSYFHHPYWLLFTLFVGINLFQADFTGFCPLAVILKALGNKQGQAFS